MTENADDHILILTELSKQAVAKRAERGLTDRILKQGISAVNVSALKQNMQAFFHQLQEIIDPGKETIGAFELSQIEVTAQVTGDGRVCLLGIGGEIEVRGGIKFVLNRVEK